MALTPWSSIDSLIWADFSPSLSGLSAVGSMSYHFSTEALSIRSRNGILKGLAQLIVFGEHAPVVDLNSQIFFQVVIGVSVMVFPQSGLLEAAAAVFCLTPFLPTCSLR